MEELVALATSGATALVGVAMSDAWTVFKSRVGALFGLDEQAEGEAVLRELEDMRDGSRTDQQGGTATADAEGRLSGRLLDLLTEQPSLAGELRDLLTDAQTAVNNGTMVVGDQTQVSNVYNYYANPAVVPSSGRGVAAPVPRIPGPQSQYYENNWEIQRQMDEAWASCKGGRVRTVLYLYGVLGIGSSATAHHWRRRRNDELPERQLRASLGRDASGNLPDIMAILERWFRELGVPKEDVPADPESRQVFFQALTERAPLLVMLEDVVLASQVAQLMPGSSDSVVLITSNSLLPQLVATYHALPVKIPPLPPEHSRKVLVKVGLLEADAVKFAPELDRITEACGGLPLALCLAGGQLAVGYPGRIRELAVEMSTRETRLGAFGQEGELTATAMAASSYRSFVERAPVAARLYRRLGLHPTAGFHMDVVGALLPGTDESARGEALSALVVANLVERTGPETYAFQHHLIHDHALACTHADEPEAEREAALDRLLRHFMEFAERMDAALSSRYRHDPAGAYPEYAPTGPVDQQAVVAELELRRESLCRAVGVAHETRRYEVAWRLNQGMWTFFLRCGYHAAWIETAGVAYESALECGDLLAAARMRYSRGYARLDRWSRVQGDPEAAREDFEQALVLVRPEGRQQTEGERRTESSLLEGLGQLTHKEGDAERALEYLDAALRALDGIAHPRGRALIAFHTGPVYTALGRHDEAAAELTSARDQFTALPKPDYYNEARTLTRYAEARQAAGELEEALGAFGRAIRIMPQHGTDYQQAIIFHLRGKLLFEQGDRARGASDWSAAAGLFRKANSPRAQEVERHLAEETERTE